MSIERVVATLRFLPSDHSRSSVSACRGSHSRSSLRFPLAALLLLGGAVALPAQHVVILKNGNCLTGKVTPGDDEHVVLETRTGRLQIRRSDIASVRKDRPDRHLSQGEKLTGPEAIRHYEKVYERFPKEEVVQERLIAAYLAEGRRLRTSGRDGEAAMLFGKAATLAPDDANAAAGLREAELAIRKLRRELEGLAALLTEHPKNDYARFQLGQLYERLGERTAAFREYLTIVKGKIRFDGDSSQIDRLRLLIEQSLVVDPVPTTQVGIPEGRRVALPGPWRTVESRNFTVYHHNSELAQQIVTVAETWLPKIPKLLGLAATPAVRKPSKCTIRVYRNATEYHAASAPIGTSGYLVSPDVILTHQCAPRLLRSVIPHELAHVLLYRSFGRLPPWVDEGLAVRMEPEKGVYYAKMKEWIRRGEYIPLATLFGVTDLGRSRVDRDRFYAEAYTLVDFLVEEKGSLKEFVGLLRALRTLPAAKALAEHFHIADVEQLEREWGAYVGL